MADKTPEEIAAERAAKWNELFKDEDPAKVKEQLDHARTWEKRAKENREKAEAHDAVVEKAKKYDELQAAGKTDLEKERERAEKAEQALAERDAKDAKAKEEADAKAALDKARDEVATAKGISSDLLRGDSKEEFEKHAAALIEAGIKPAAAPPADGQGNTGTGVSTGDEKSADEIVNGLLGK